MTGIRGGLKVARPSRQFYLEASKHSGPSCVRTLSFVASTIRDSMRAKKEYLLDLLYVVLGRVSYVLPHRPDPSS